jgi:hypothetical protein
MRRKPCARCGRPPHPSRLYLDCLSYVAPAPLWMLLLNRALGAVIRRFS